jgi:hypothetical protein
MTQMGSTVGHLQDLENPNVAQVNGHALRRTRMVMQRRRKLRIPYAWQELGSQRAVPVNWGPSWVESWEWREL